MYSPRKLKISNRGLYIKLLITAFLILKGSSLFAGGLATTDFNYINDLIGGRATGLGGAYTAVSDDPSGAFYNPAGLMFAFDNQISLSVNSYKKKYITMDKAISGNAYTQEIETFYPSFFGVVQSLGSMKLAITIVNVNNDILDQDDFFPGITATADDGVPYPATFNINYNLTDNTLLGGLSLAMFLSDSLTFGVTLYGLNRRREQIANQIITYDKASTTTYQIQNQYITEEMWGTLVNLGFQWMPSKSMALGLSVSKGLIFSHQSVAQTYFKQESAGTNINETNPDGSLKFAYLSSSVEYSDSEIPFVVRGGVAFFPSKKMLLTADVIGHIGTKYYQATVKSTINGAAGIEYYVNSSFPVRFGIFTNFANTPAISSSKLDQEMHVDLYGASFSLSWQTKNSSITLSGFGQYGTGDAQVIGGTTALQGTSILLFSVALTGSAKY